MRIVVVESATQQHSAYRGVEKFPPPLVTLQGKWVWCCCPKLVQFSPLKFTHSNRTPVRPPPCPVCKAAKLMHKYQFCSFHSRKQGACFALTLWNQIPFRPWHRANPFLRLESYAHSSLFSSLPKICLRSRGGGRGSHAKKCKCTQRRRH